MKITTSPSKRAEDDVGRGYGLDFWETSFEVLDYKRMKEVAAFGCQG